jgi:hypothetical protein
MKQIGSLLMLVLAALLVIVMHSCAKNTGCVTCVAKHNGNEVGSRNACNESEQQSFRAEYYYANVTCE